MQRRILIAVDAPGPAEFIAPVIPLLRHGTWDKRHGNWETKIVTVGNSDTNILKQYRPIQCTTQRDAERVFRSFRPHTLLLGMSSLPKTPVHRLPVSLAAREHIPLIAFQDYWGNHRNPENAPILKHAQKILVPDLFAQTLLLEDGFRGEIVITGNPAFQKFSRVNVARERAKIRKKLGIPARAFFVLYVGTGTPQSAKMDEITFIFFARAIDLFKRSEKNLFVAVHAHPRDEHPNRYRELAPRLTTVDTSRFPLADSLLPAADVVISMYSTNLIHACFLRIPGISILLPNAGRKRLRQFGLDDFPPNRAGATVGIYTNSPALLARTLNRLNHDRTFRKTLVLRQKKYFPHTNAATRAVLANVS